MTETVRRACAQSADGWCKSVTARHVPITSELKIRSLRVLRLRYVTAQDLFESVSGIERCNLSGTAGNVLSRLKEIL